MSIKPDNIRIVRDLILERPEQFDMEVLVFSGDPDGSTVAGLEHPCGTVACIAGWAAFASGYRGGENREIEQRAADFLGLEMTRLSIFMISGPAADLFYPSGETTDAYLATAEQAAKVLDHLIETGEIDWSKARD